MNWLKNNLSYIKTVLIFVFVLALIVSLFFGNKGNRRIIDLNKKMIRLEEKNNQLEKQQKIYVVNLETKEKERDSLETLYKELKKEKVRLEKENRVLRTKIDDIPLWVNENPVDSSYNFLTVIAYPYDGDYRYPFNEKQVKGIHTDYLENIQYKDLIAVQDTQLMNYRGTVFILEAFSDSYKESIELLQKKNNGLEQMLENEEDKTKLCEKELKKQNKKRNLWRISTGVVSTIAITLLFL